MSSATPAPIPDGATTGPLLDGAQVRAPAPSGEVLPVGYSGPFKACKEELVRAFEREYLTRLLGRTKGNIARAAREAELDRKHLYSLLHKHGLVQSDGD
jgi:DNA-binding NtrC family response regulator